MSSLYNLTLPGIALAHEVRPAIADVTVKAEKIEVEIRLTAESLVSGLDLTGLQDTNDAPEAQEYDRLRALKPALLEAEFEKLWPDLAPGFKAELQDGETLALTLGSVAVGPIDDVELPRDTNVSLFADLPSGESPIRFGWVSKHGPIIVRQANAGENAYAGFLEGGQLSDPLPRTAEASKGFWNTLWRFFSVGE